MPAAAATGLPRATTKTAWCDSSTHQSTEQRIEGNGPPLRCLESPRAGGVAPAAGANTGRPSPVPNDTLAPVPTADRSARYFVCARGHEIVADGIGRVVQEEPSFVIVEELGAAGDVAERADPRGGRHA